MQQLNQYVRIGHVTKAPLVILLLGMLAIVILAIYIANTHAQEHDGLADGSDDSTLKLPSQANIVSYLEKKAQENIAAVEDSGRNKSDKYYLDMYDSQYNVQEHKTEDLSVTAPNAEPTWDPQIFTPPSPKEQLQANIATARAQALLQALSAQASVANTNNSSLKRQSADDYDSNGSNINSNYANSSLAQNYVNDAASKLAQLQKVNGYQAYAANGNGNGFVSANSRIEPHQTLNAYQSLVNNDTTMVGKVEEVLSPYLVRQGAVIPCTLLTGINSDLPGLVQAQVSQDVYDSPNGRHILIPKGSKVVGQYASAPMMGQERLMMAFNRVIFPDGKAMDLGAMVGSGLDGYSGFSADVDNHFMRMIGNAILLGGVTAGISLSVDDKRDDDGDLTINGALSQSLGQSIGRVLTNVIERNMNMAPTLKVKPGFSFNVTLVKDIYFSQPYTTSNH